MSVTTALKLLGLQPGATAEAVKAAYRKAVKTAHPDAGGETRKFLEVKAAYDSLVANGTGGQQRSSHSNYAQAQTARAWSEPFQAAAWERPIKPPRNRNKVLRFNIRRDQYISLQAMFWKATGTVYGHYLFSSVDWFPIHEHVKIKIALYWSRRWHRLHQRENWRPMIEALWDAHIPETGP